MGFKGDLIVGLLRGRRKQNVLQKFKLNNFLLSGIKYDFCKNKWVNNLYSLIKENNKYFYKV